METSRSRFSRTRSQPAHALVALILTFGPISGAHFNPAVTLADASQGGLAWREVPGYLVAQIAGAFAGVAAAHLMFGEPLFFASRHVRAGSAQLFSEFVATFGLLSVIWGCARLRSSAVPFAVGAYITAAYWFTASTSFANPAVTLARAASDTFAGIRPADAPGFIVAQLAGAARRHGALSVAGAVASQRRREGCRPTRSPGEHPCRIRNESSSCAPEIQPGARWPKAFCATTRGTASRYSAPGTKPSHVRPEAIAVMHELGIDISGHRSKSVDEFAGQSFDYVLTVCDNAKESCPIFAGKTVTIHKNFEDPAALRGSEDQRLALFRRVRDEMRSYLRVFPPK